MREIHGVDGAYIDTTKLLIDPANFTAADLFGPFTLDACYDLAVCLEVGEHLPHRTCRHLVAELTRVAPVVLFSGCHSRTARTGHINEQWPAYWCALFARHGFTCLDVLRRYLLHDDRIEWWYRQNMFLDASCAALSQTLALRAEADKASTVPFVCIEEGVFAPHTSFGGLLSLLPGAAWRAIRNRFGGG